MATAETITSSFQADMVRGLRPPPPGAEEPAEAAAPVTEDAVPAPGQVRWVEVGAGVVLAVGGLRRRTLFGVFAAGVGAALILDGLAGRGAGQGTRVAE